MYRSPFTRLTGVLPVALLVAACTHDQPAGPGSYVPQAPHDNGPLVRLTYNLGLDQYPAWLPDGSGFFYTAERVDRPDRDRCLARFAAGGGSIVAETCVRGAVADDSVDALSSAAVSISGRIAYVRASAPLGASWPIAPRYQDLVTAPLAHPEKAGSVLALPFGAPSGNTVQGISQVRWFGDTALVFVGQHVVYAPACRGCVFDTLATGLELDVLDLRTAAVRTVAGSEQASSVAVVGPDTLYFTLNGDSRVLRLSLADDSLSVAHDFGASGIARDVQVAGDRLVAVVGGNVSFVDDPVTGLVQRDSGGPLVLVDLATGAETTFTPPSVFYRRPALSPDGTLVIAEAIVNRTSDLWLVAVP